MKAKWLYFLLAFLLFFQGCYKDDLKDCPIMLHVYFKSVMKKYTYKEIVDRLDLYLYNQGGAFVEKFSFSADELQMIGYEPVLPIWDFGDYTLVTEVNAGNSYTVESGSLDAFRVSLKAEQGNMVRSKQEDLYHAHKELSLPFTGIIHQYDTLDLYKNTNHFNVDVSFEGGYIPTEANIQASILGSNGSYDYTNLCQPNSSRTYLPHSRNEKSGHILMQFTTMQIRYGNDLVLRVDTEDSGGIKTEKSRVDIMKMLSTNYPTNDDLDQEDIYDIKLVLKDDYSVLEMMINDWYVIRQGEVV